MNTLPPFFLGVFSCSHWSKCWPVSSTIDFAPPGGQKRLALGGDGFVLQFPEQVRVGEIAVLSEQVGDDLPGVICQPGTAPPWWRSTVRRTAIA